YAERHALVHLPLDSCPVSDWCDREPGLIKVRPDLRHVAKHLDVRTREFEDLRRGLGTDHLEHALRDACLDQGKDLPGKEEHRVSVGRMLESADKEDVASAFETRNIGLVDREDGRDDPDIQPRTLLLK